MYECNFQFRGKNMDCLPPEKICDGNIDCDNRADEYQCTYCVTGLAFLCQEWSDYRVGLWKHIYNSKDTRASKSGTKRPSSDEKYLLFIRFCFDDLIVYWCSFILLSVQYLYPITLNQSCYCIFNRKCIFLFSLSIFSVYQLDWDVIMCLIVQNLMAVMSPIVPLIMLLWLHNYSRPTGAQMLNIFCDHAIVAR